MQALVSKYRAVLCASKSSEHSMRERQRRQRLEVLEAQLLKLCSND